MYTISNIGSQFYPHLKGKVFLLKSIAIEDNKPKLGEFRCLGYDEYSGRYPLDYMVPMFTVGLPRFSSYQEFKDSAKQKSPYFKNSTNDPTNS